MKNEEALVERHRYLVLPIARTFGLPESYEDDLVQEGLVGLWQAARRYDPSRQKKFATYASHRIRGAMRDWLRTMDTASRTARRRMRVIASEQAKATQRGEDVSEERLAQRLGVPLKSLRDLQTELLWAETVSIEDIAHEDEQWGDPWDAVTSSNGLDGHVFKGERQRIVDEAIAQLPPREHEVMAFYYRGDLTMKAVGRILGLTEARICQLHSQACARLRQHLAEVHQDLEA